ncbi:MAG: iron-containing alcohol dehydrogenase, partial [Alistipes sp.]|nr:iron-containing alcohol dehydrogenase [Alistipes sp.]
MRDFTYYAPTEVVFGARSEERIGKLIAKYNGTKVLVHYGGKSAEKSGLLAVVREQLNAAGIPFVELGGVVPNPRVSKVREGIDFILAVGGGSVIDSSKAIAVGVHYEGDVWDFFLGKAKAG